MIDRSRQADSIRGFRARPLALSMMIVVTPRRTMAPKTLLEFLVVGIVGRRFGRTAVPDDGDDLCQDGFAQLGLVPIEQRRRFGADEAGNQDGGQQHAEVIGPVGRRFEAEIRGATRSDILCCRGLGWRARHRRCPMPHRGPGATSRQSSV